MNNPASSVANNVAKIAVITFNFQENGCILTDTNHIHGHDSLVLARGSSKVNPLRFALTLQCNWISDGTALWSKFTGSGSDFTRK
jgi:hypothetical protein